MPHTWRQMSTALVSWLRTVAIAAPAAPSRNRAIKTRSSRTFSRVVQSIMSIGTRLSPMARRSE